MTQPRRRLIRPVLDAEPANPQQQRKIQKLRERLDRERASLARWQSRFKRAFNSVQRIQNRIARIERQLTQSETQSCLGPANARSPSSRRA
jgi:septal ring factor EnvC (AmiA/AmiB activator)